MVLRSKQVLDSAIRTDSGSELVARQGRIERYRKQHFAARFQHSYAFGKGCRVIRNVLHNVECQNHVAVCVCERKFRQILISQVGGICLFEPSLTSKYSLPTSLGKHFCK